MKRLSSRFSCCAGLTRQIALFLAVTATLTAQTGTVGYEQRLGESLPLEVILRDESGLRRPIAAYFKQAPVVVIFGYFNCPQLCSVVSSAAIDALRQIRPVPQNRFSLLYISIDPKDTSVEARKAWARDLREFAHSDSADNWHYLTGDEVNLERVARAAGFNYRYDPATRQYAHPSGFLIATPEGVISRYFLGIDFLPAEIDAALHQARAGKIGPSTFQLLLQCFRGDGIAGAHGPLIWRVLQVAVGSTVLLLALGIGWMLFQDRERPERKGAA